MLVEFIAHISQVTLKVLNAHSLFIYLGILWVLVCMPSHRFPRVPYVRVTKDPRKTRPKPAQQLVNLNMYPRVRNHILCTLCL